MILVLTGNGKGKTTSAIGTATRALGYKQKVLVIQFMKESATGEILFLKKLKTPNLKLHICGKGFYKIKGDHATEEEHKKSAKKGIEKLKEELNSFSPALVILDEINNACSLKLIDPAEIIKITTKYEKTNFILTGRNAPKEFIEKSDLVTEMKEIKHPFSQGQTAQKGIDL